jgi:MATE family multidrug resistance protein
MNDSQVLDNSEIIAITSKLLLIAIFQISDGIQVVVLGALRGLQDVKIPMHYLCGVFMVFLFPIIWASIRGCWNLDRTLGRINSGSYFFIHSLCETYKKLVLQNHKE